MMFINLFPDVQLQGMGALKFTWKYISLSASLHVIPLQL